MMFNTFPNTTRSFRYTPPVFSMMQIIPPPDWDFNAGRIVFDTGPKRGTDGRVASRITPQLYLSDYWTARDDRKLKALGITHVISLTDFNPEIPDCISSENKLHIDIGDESRANMLQHLPTTTAFIIAAMQEDKANKVLVHCMMGVSRSATVVCAYLVATTNMSATESVSHVQSIRRIVCPNLGFRQQLEQYSTQFVKTKKFAWLFMWTEIFSFSPSWMRLRGKSGAAVSSSSHTHRVST